LTPDPSTASRERPTLRIAMVNSAVDRDIENADALVARYYETKEWADALADAGGGSVAVVQRFRRDFVERRSAVDYHFVAAPAFSLSLWASRVVRTLRELNADVVHVDGLVFPFLVRHLRMALPKRTALVVQDHGGIHAGSPGFARCRWRTLHRMGLRAADAFFFTSREQAAPWQSAGIIGASQTVHEVPECSSVLWTTAGAPAGHHTLPGRPALLWVGRLNANKDPFTILEGFEQVARALPDAALTLVYGENDLLGEVMSKIAASSLLRSRVHLRGRVPHREMPGLYGGADLFVLGSHHEAASISLIEALSFGVTPIVTDIPAFRAIVSGGRVGGLFPPGSPSEFARAVMRLSVDFAARRPIVRGYFERELSWPVVARKALAGYQAAADDRCKRAALRWRDAVR
jgi:glycosyltransferase involved in cell wall biosynthesis